MMSLLGKYVGDLLEGVGAVTHLLVKLSKA